MNSPELNQVIPDFETSATSNVTFCLADFKSKANIILYFYPKDNTPGCTLEGRAFRNLYHEFQSLDTEIFGISREKMRSHENFKAKQCFPFELISDPDEIVCRLFDVIKLKKFFGKQYMGIERSTFLIDKTGILRQEWRKVKVRNHANEVLEAVKKL